MRKHTKSGKIYSGYLETFLFRLFVYSYLLSVVYLYPVYQWQHAVWGVAVLSVKFIVMLRSDV